MVYFLTWAIFWALVGSFGTAYLHERTGRDVQMGGLIGGVVGAIGGIFFLMCLWVWLYYGYGGLRRSNTWRIHNARRHWYNWWN